jgi:hypothetical protein
MIHLDGNLRKTCGLMAQAGVRVMGADGEGTLVGEVAVFVCTYCTL